MMYTCNKFQTHSSSENQVRQESGSYIRRPRILSCVISTEESGKEEKGGHFWRGVFDSSRNEQPNKRRGLRRDQGQKQPKLVHPESLKDELGTWFILFFYGHNPGLSSYISCSENACERSAAIQSLTKHPLKKPGTTSYAALLIPVHFF